MNRRLLIVGALAAAVIAVAWFLTNFERVPVTERTPMSGEARLRPFLAAERFAARMGMRSTEKRSIPELDALPVAGVLLLPAQRQALDSRRIDRLIAWVERGGHLIVEAEFLGVADPLLDKVGVRRSQGAQGFKPIPVAIPGSERKLSVLLAGAVGLQPPVAKPRLIAGPRAAASLVSFARGKGMITATGSLAFARNQRIGDHDHAEFLWVLLGLTGAGEFDVFFRPERLSLWSFLVGHADAALLSAAALLALWLWRIAPRFGPVAPDPPPGRRRLLDHLRASGRYFWARGLRELLVSAARDSALRRVARAHPDFSSAPPAERAARLAAAAGIPRGDAAVLLSEGGTERAAEFMAVVHQAQRVHAALDHGVTGGDQPTQGEK
ncbi:MAG TPA: DUF4350 domain-containing protein [Burkholderiales bacterium]|nr:DUF4350 domain-containing protein [Burkholderiales bacterium]